MKKFLLSILLSYFAFNLFGCNESVQSNSLETDEATHTSQLENDNSYETQSIAYSIDETINLDDISDNDFLSLIDSYTNSIQQSLYIINEINYGRIIASSTSSENAISVCTRHFTDERFSQAINTVIECNVVYESDIFYGIHVKWKVTNNGKFRGQYEENVISFKKEIADVTVRNVIYGDDESFKIHTNEEEQIKRILLYLHCNKNPFEHLLDYEITSIENEYVMTIYSIKVVGGDWGIKDEYSLLKYTITFDIETNDIIFQEPIKLKTVYK